MRFEFFRANAHHAAVLSPAEARPAGHGLLGDGVEAECRAHHLLGGLLRQDTQHVFRSKLHRAGSIIKENGFYRWFDQAPPYFVYF